MTRAAPLMRSDDVVSAPHMFFTRERTCWSLLSQSNADDHTQDRLAQNYHSEDSPFTFFCCTYHPACPSFIRTATLIQYLFCRCLTLLCNFPFFPLSKLNNDFLLAFILYLILHGIPRSEVELEAKSQTFAIAKYGNGGYLLTNIMSANQY